MGKKIFFDIILNSKSANENLNKLNSAFGNITKSAIKFAGAVGLSFSVFSQIKRAVNDYLEFDHTLARLSNTLIRLGVYHKDVVERMLKEQSRLQEELEVNDEVIREIYNQLLTFGVPLNYVNELTEGIIRFSKTIGIDFQSAAFLVAKSITGNINFLQRYGIEFKKTGELIADTVNLIETLQVRFGSRMTDIFQSYREELKHYQLAYDDFLENIGKYIVKGADSIFRALIPMYGRRLELTEKIEELITETQEELSKKRLETLSKYSQAEKDVLVKRLNELTPLLKEYEQKFIVARSQLWSAMESGDKLRTKAGERLVEEVLKNYNLIKGEVEALNQLLDEKVKNEQKSNDYIKQEEERVNKLLSLISNKIKYLELTNKLTETELEKSIRLLRVELERAEKRKDYAKAVDILERINSLQAQYNYYSRFSVDNIKQLNSEYEKLANKVQVPKELSEVKSIEVSYNIDNYFRSLEYERDWLQMYFTDVFDNITQGFKGSSELASQFIYSMRSAFHSVFSEIGNSFVAMWESAFGRANSLLEIFLQKFSEGLVQMAAMYAASKVFTAIFGSGALALILHKGGVIGKAHSGMMSRDEVPIIAKKGEMILNDRQQAILWNMINYGRNEKAINNTIIVNIDGEVITEKVVKSKLPKLLNKLSYAI